MNDSREKLIELLESAESAFYWNSDDKSFVEKIADHLIANGVTFAKDMNVPTKWIPVTERLPEPGVDVLVCTTKGISKAHCYEDGSWHGAGGCWRNVTHWMPMPEPPKEG